MLPVGLKKMSITSVCTSSSPEMYTGKDLESITFVSRKSGSEKYELTDRKKKEFGVRKTGSGILVHRGLNSRNRFEQERVHSDIRKEKPAFACGSTINMRASQWKK